MMINKRLINMLGHSKKYIAGSVFSQWCSLVANVVMIGSISCLLQALFNGTAGIRMFLIAGAITLAAVIVRYGCSVFTGKMSFLSSKMIKKNLRKKIYLKLSRLGAAYQEKVSTSEVVLVAVEGVEQLEIYFGAYLPQFFYAVLAPVTLFFVMSLVNLRAAIVLLVCIPLIPVAIAVVQTWAKKLLSKYWGQYTALGDTFLENLQGLTTLKIYQADDLKNEEMNQEAEKFRKITMKVLTMQLNSITIMDLIAYGGAGLGIIIAVTQYAAGNVSLAGCLFIILISADFFIPMRQLGSFFHIAMNGMAASDKIFRLLDLPETEKTGEKECPNTCAIVCAGINFSYHSDREILCGVDMNFPIKSFISIVGESGCGKSTLASILMGKNKGYSGTVCFGDSELSEVSEESLMTHITYIGHQSYLFKGTVRENLLMGSPKAADTELWEVLHRVRLADYLRCENGLDTQLAERASNLSGGQCQRLALARGLLHDSPVYIFDEAASNIDVESENDIMREIHALAKRKTVILITHRLFNAVDSDNIYVLERGRIAESGSHTKLLCNNSVYAKLWKAQQALENYTKEAKTS